MRQILEPVNPIKFRCEFLTIVLLLEQCCVCVCVSVCLSTYLVYISKVWWHTVSFRLLKIYVLCGFRWKYFVWEIWRHLPAWWSAKLTPTRAVWTIMHRAVWTIMHRYVTIYNTLASCVTTSVFFPTYLRHVGPASLQHRYFFDMGKHFDVTTDYAQTLTTPSSHALI